MNPLTNMKNVKKLSEQELKGRNKTSWHDQYRGSAWIFVGGLPFDLTEGDIICVFSQYGEPVNINLVRDKDSGKSKGFCFICYEDQRSTDLAVDNLNGIKLLGRILRVDHVNDYKPPKERKDDDDITKVLKREGLPGVAAIKNEVPVSVKREKSLKIVVKTEKVSDSETEEEQKKVKSVKKEKVSDSESEEERKKVKSKKKNKKTHKNKKESSSESSSGSEESDSSSDSDEEVKRRKKKKMRRVQENDFSEGETDKKHKKRRATGSEKDHKGKTAKSIEELQKEAILIQEELKRRQLSKELEEVQKRINDSKKLKEEKRSRKHVSSSRDHDSWQNDYKTARSREGERDDHNDHRHKEHKTTRSSEEKGRKGDRHKRDRKRSRTPDRLVGIEPAREARHDQMSLAPRRKSRSRSPSGRDRYGRSSDKDRNRARSPPHHRRRRSPF